MHHPLIVRLAAEDGVGQEEAVQGRRPTRLGLGRGEVAHGKGGQ